MMGKLDQLHEYEIRSKRDWFVNRCFRTTSLSSEIPVRGGTARRLSRFLKGCKRKRYFTFEGLIGAVVLEGDKTIASAKPKLNNKSLVFELGMEKG